jgi:hypothetical protein
MNSNEPLLVQINREPGCPGGDTFTLTLPDKQILEFEPDPCREWFRLRGANMDVVENALDECWNFWESSVLIKNPRWPKKVVTDSTEPLV